MRLQFLLTQTILSTIEMIDPLTIRPQMVEIRHCRSQQIPVPVPRAIEAMGVIVHGTSGAGGSSHSTAGIV